MNHEISIPYFSLIWRLKNISLSCYRKGVWSLGAVLQLRVQELPWSTPWRQPLFLHLPAGQLLPGAWWLQHGFSQTTRTHWLPLKLGGWWVTVTCLQKMNIKWIKYFQFLFFSFFLKKQNKTIFFCSYDGGCTRCGFNHRLMKMIMKV